MTARITYNGSTPGADSNTYNLFSTVTAFPGASMLAMTGSRRFALDLKYSTGCTLKTYKSDNRGTDWRQIKEHLLLPPISTGTYRREFAVEAYRDWKIDLVNGGAAQSPFVLDMSLDGGTVLNPAQHDFKYWTNAVMSADVTGDWVDCQDAVNVSWNLEWASTPTGDLYLEVTNDPARAAANITQVNWPAGCMSATLTAGTATISGNKIVLTGATGNMSISIDRPYKWMRLFWDSSASGSSTLDGFVSTRYV